MPSHAQLLKAPSRFRACDAGRFHPPRLRVKLRNAKEKMGDVQEVVADRAKAAARATDDFVHDNPWKAVGIAAGVGFLIGLLVNRK